MAVVKGHLFGIFKSKSFQNILGLVGLLTTILAQLQ